MFYGTKSGDKLVDESNYPSSIKDYLKKEREILEEYLKNYNLLIEVGCMEARNLDVAINNKKGYIGIDIVPSYIEKSKKIIKEINPSIMCDAYCLDAEKMKELKKMFIRYKEYKSLIYFPFNSFGNMNNPYNVINNFIHLEESDFIIFSYGTDEKSTDERMKYYENCNYKNLKYSSSNKGVRFYSDDGLNTIAYSKDYIEQMIKETSKLKVKTRKFEKIGVYYYINSKEE